MSNCKSGQKKEKLKARLPRGFIDRGGDEIRAMNNILSIIGGVYERYGFDPLETPMLEYADCLGKFLPDADRPNEGVFSLNDGDEQWMSLRYDLTAPLARHVAENFNKIQMPYRTYRSGWAFRNEKPGPGRFRQFMQMDADSIGAPGITADAEMCMMMADAMESSGIERGNFLVLINNRKTLDGMMEAFRVPEEKRMTVLRAIDKYDRLGIEGVRQLLGKGREDPSGDIAEGAGLGEEQIANIVALLGIEGHEQETMPDPRRTTGTEITRQYENMRADNILTKMADRLAESPVGLDGVAELRQMWEIISFSGYNDCRVRVEPSIVRGLEYYTGLVYEATLTFPVVNEKGEEVIFGSVGGGGRYDGLIKRFTGQTVPATGFSIGASRLIAALKSLGKLQTPTIVPPVLVTIMDGNRVNDYQKMAQTLRSAGIRAEIYQGNWKKFGNQLKYADRRGCPLAIIQGEDERATGEIQIKDLVEGKRLSEAIEDNATWRKRRPAQVKVREDALIDEVRRILGEHAENGVKAISGKAESGFPSRVTNKQKSVSEF